MTQVEEGYKKDNFPFVQFVQENPLNKLPKIILLLPHRILFLREREKKKSENQDKKKVAIKNIYTNNFMIFNNTKRLIFKDLKNA